MKGMALETVGFVIIALVGVLLLILFISGSLSDLTKNVFCFFYEKVSSKNIETCEEIEKPMEQITISPKSSEDLARYIAAYSIICWENARKSIKTKDTNCFNLRLEGGSLSPPVYEIDVTNILISEGGCNRLENSQSIDSSGGIQNTNCGTHDNIGWEVDGGISDQKLILIKYSDFNRQVIIKG
ncbi:MAG: hypothetical protein QXY45_00925 [Candidatus Aenigmatarchaeota archaeon]